MAQHLPDDVWSQIAEIQSPWLGRGALNNMSLASRRMHRLVVPVLFRDLSFDIFLRKPESLMVKLIRNNMRARFLFDSPELMRHTRVFTYRENPNTRDSESIDEFLALREDSGSSSWRGEAESFFAIFHDVIYRLIFRMPGLRDLRIGNTVMTPLGYAAISSRRLLTSLSLEPRRLPDITHINPALPRALRLRTLACYYYTWTDNDPPTDPYFTDILDHCILDLEKLSISSDLLPLVVSCIPLHHTLSLRFLSMRFNSYSPEGGLAAAFFQVLRACPQLLHLDVPDDFSEVEPTHYLPPPSLPNLSTFYGTSRLLQKLSGGTNLVNISLYANFYVDEQSLNQIILSSPMHLRVLFIGQVIVSQTPHELLTFIQPLAVFQNLERLDITYEPEFDISWKDHVSAQDSHSTLKNLLNQLVCLRSFNISTLQDEVVDGYDIGCPISNQGEPTDRGHLSLEYIYVDFLCGMWVWNSRTGWEEGGGESESESEGEGEGE